MTGAEQESGAAGGSAGMLLGAGAGLVVLAAGALGLWLASAPPTPTPTPTPEPVPASAAKPVPPAAMSDARERPAPEPAPTAVARAAGAAVSATDAPAADAPVADAPVADGGDEAAPGEPSGAAAAEPAVPADTGSRAASVVGYDALRVTPEGALTLAGRAVPGAEIDLVLEGETIATTTADASGAFAALADVAPAATPRVLQLRVTGADGVTRTAAENLTVAPSPRALETAATAQGETPAALAAQVQAAQLLADKPLVTDAAGGARVLGGQTTTMGIDTLAFDAEGRITISGRGAAGGALLRAYVDGAEAGLVQAGPDGAWTMDLPKVAAGAHALRVDALDADGKVLARAEQAFTAVAPRRLTAAVRSVAPTGPADVPREHSAAGQPAARPATRPAAAPTAPPDIAQPGAPVARAITIAPGNTLWAIAREAYGDPYLYVQIFDANRVQIRDPDLIYPGQVFTLPR